MKRGESGLSFVCAIDKPSGLSSHDVVNTIRRIFAEKRVGHAGTLDPLASGVLPILVGSAARLSDYLMGHDKDYVVDIAFGTATTTDDAEGEVLRSGPVPDEVFDPFFARTFVYGLVGTSMQIPPIYSALKVNGKKAYEEARRGHVFEIEPREIEVYSAELLAIESDPIPAWKVAFRVSKGTYIRALARDVGNALGVPAHVSALRRLTVGKIRIDDCVTLPVAEEVGIRIALDPVKLLGLRFAFVDGKVETKVSNGNRLSAENVELYEYTSSLRNDCACTSGVVRAGSPLSEGERICVIAKNQLKAIYSYDAERALFKPERIFQIGVIRGSDL